jgi:hypothetical protein
MPKTENPKASFPWPGLAMGKEILFHGIANFTSFWIIKVGQNKAMDRSLNSKAHPDEKELPKADGFKGFIKTGHGGR